MWDSVRAINKGESTCISVKCKECQFNKLERGCNGGGFINVFEKIEIVEKWSNEHPSKKYKVSQLEYDILKSYLDYKNHMTVDIADYFFEDGLLLSLLKKGYFKGATKEMLINDYLNDCEVVD